MHRGNCLLNDTKERGEVAKRGEQECLKDPHTAVQVVK